MKLLAFALLFILVAGLASSAYASHGDTVYIRNAFLLITIETTFEDGTVTSTDDKLDYLRYWSYKYSFIPGLSVFNAYTQSGVPIESVRVTYEFWDKNPDFSIGPNNNLGYSIYFDDNKRIDNVLDSGSASLIFETREESDGYTVYTLYDKTFSAAEVQSKLSGGKGANSGNLVARADSIIGTYKEDVNKRIGIDDDDNDVKIQVSTDGIVLEQPEPTPEPEPEPTPEPDPVPDPEPTPEPEPEPEICLANNQDCDAENPGDIVVHDDGILSYWPLMAGFVVVGGVTVLALKRRK